MRKTHLIAAAIAVTGALALAGCSAGPADPAPAVGEGGRIEHAFGETRLPQSPERIVTIGWGATDAALALGVVPVGIESQQYGAESEGVLPWVRAALQEAGAQTPTLLSSANQGAPAYEEIAALEPELILAPYSGIDQEQYGLLSEIAPTVAYPSEPWATPWRDVIVMTGAALGRSEEASELVSTIEQQLSAAAAEHPEFAGRTVAAIRESAGELYVYKPADPRVEFLTDLGFVSAPSVDALASGQETFYYTLSQEKTAELDAEVLVVYADTQAEYDAFLAQPYAQAIPAVQRGAVAPVVGPSLVASLSPPTALSVSWGLNDYLAALTPAVEAVGSAAG